MDRQLTPSETIVLENANLRLQIHDLISKARKVVESSWKAGKSGRQRLVLAEYLNQLQDEIVNYDVKREEEMAARKEKELKDKSLIKI